MPDFLFGYGVMGVGGEYFRRFPLSLTPFDTNYTGDKGRKTPTLRVVWSPIGCWSDSGYVGESEQTADQKVPYLELSDFYNKLKLGLLFFLT